MCERRVFNFYLCNAAEANVTLRKECGHPFCLWVPPKPCFLFFQSSCRLKRRKKSQADGGEAMPAVREEPGSRHRRPPQRKRNQEGGGGDRRRHRWRPDWSDRPVGITAVGCRRTSNDGRGERGAETPENIHLADQKRQRFSSQEVRLAEQGQHWGVVRFQQACRFRLRRWVQWSVRLEPYCLHGKPPGQRGTRPGRRRKLPLPLLFPGHPGKGHGRGNRIRCQATSPGGVYNNREARRRGTTRHKDNNSAAHDRQTNEGPPRLREVDENGCQQDMGHSGGDSSAGNCAR